MSSDAVSPGAVSPESEAPSPEGLTRPTPSLGPLGWAIVGWGIGGVSLILLNPIVRLGLQATDALAGGLTPIQRAVLVPWVAFMLFTEGYRGFHQQFSPRVVLRSFSVGARPRVGPALLAPAMAMGLVFATPKRLGISWALVVMIVGLVVGVRLLPTGWRAVVDVGVVCGLAAGLLSLWWHTARALTGSLSPMPADLPWPDEDPFGQ